MVQRNEPPSGHSTRPVTVNSEAGNIVGGRREDRDAFEALFRTYYAGLCRFALRYASQPEVAEDLVQDVFFNLWKRRHEWVPERSAKAYLYGAVRKWALKHLRHQGVVARWRDHAKAEPIPIADEIGADLSQKELERALQEAVERLPERRRLVYELSRKHGLTYAEIALALGVSVKTVEMQMTRALKFLRTRLVAFSPALH